MTSATVAAVEVDPDKKVVTGRHLRGQPGKWRLQTGRSFVGALARGLTPQQGSVSRENDRTKLTGRKAEIQDLDRGGHGRKRCRQRRPWRQAQQKIIEINS